MKTILISSWLGLCSLLPLAAQESTTAEPKKVTGRLAHFVCTHIPKGLKNPVSLMTGKKITELTLSKRMASGPIKIPADGIVRMVREIPNPNDPETPLYQTLAQAKIPEGVSKALVILVPAPKKKAPLIFDTRVKDLASFKGGDYLYMNLSPVNIAVNLGKKTIALKPGQDQTYKAPSLTKSENVPVRYSYYHPTQQKWRMLSASTIVLRATRREICIFSWDPRYRRVNYRGVTFPVSPL
ncbi:hypothetical protein JO972_05995 [Verrucomicrobiaceae bacterium 5K15]|uniref:Uncharacterized protein n=1 Tax=Oceaniferula flava TaxID=2800421 RepID=A0AAE2SDE5_9BACT|nr:hypothetical protein [Oceaniferula flavus]MBK1854500.1 hypothetical protein [Oceaniferula flavus]MBM1135806.1 hypothetical protein [Oceaniferula flavus]